MDSYPSISSRGTSNHTRLVADDVSSQYSDDSDALDANCTHLELVGFSESSPMVIRRPNTTPSSSASTTYEIYPNVDLFMNIYLGRHQYYRRETFPSFYKSYQSTYAVPSNSQFARNFIRREPCVSTTHLQDHEYPQRYRAELLEDVDVVKGFMAMAKAASKERDIRNYCW